MTDTTPMPLVRFRPPALIGRFTVTTAGLLAAGTLVLGLGLLVAMSVLPSSGTNAFDATAGPGWPRTLAHLSVGLVAETAGQLTRRRSWPTRVTCAAATIAVVLVVLTLSWWR